MNRAARRARRTLADAEKELAAVTAGRDALLDVLNAIITQAGGKVVVPAPVVQASTRKPIHVTGHPDRYVIEFVGEETPDAPPPTGIRERLKRLGLHPV